MPIALLVLLLLALTVLPASAGPLDHPGYSKAFTCSACHVEELIATAAPNC